MSGFRESHAPVRPITDGKILPPRCAASIRRRLPRIPLVRGDRRSLDSARSGLRYDKRKRERAALGMTIEREGELRLG